MKYKTIQLGVLVSQHKNKKNTSKSTDFSGLKVEPMKTRNYIWTHSNNYKHNDKENGDVKTSILKN